MGRLNTKGMGFAVASSFALVYLACVFIVHTVPRPAAIAFFNSIIHGIDVSSIMRWEMPWWEMVIGVLQVFIIGWLFGSAIAILYNWASVPKGGGHA
jgi:protein-S-isoprenylcysteine O-methyltransferase Ste14